MICTTVKVLNEANTSPGEGERSPLANLMLVRWPTAMAWQIDEWLAEIEIHTKRFAKLMADARNEIIGRLGKDGVIKADDPNYAAAVEELRRKEEELGDVEVKLVKVETLTRDQLPDGAKLSGYDVRVLRKFLLQE